MRDVLEPLRPDAQDLHWSILDLGETVGEHASELAAIERQVLASPTCLELSFDELVTFAGRTRQVIDGLFVGCSSSSALPSRSDDDLTIVSRTDMVVAAIDSTFWLVGAADHVLAHVAAAFQTVTEVDPASTPLSTWGRDEPQPD